MIKKLLLLFLFFPFATAQAQNNSLQLANKLIYAVYKSSPTADLLTEINNLSKQQLKNDLFNDSARICFWVNLYNSAVQLKQADSANRNNKKYFTTTGISVAGKFVTLQQIEMGMLRGSRYNCKNNKQKKKVSSLEESCRVKNPDWRVYFMLNTGVVNDPFISFYEPLQYDHQRNLATRFYVTPRVNNGTLVLPSRFACYRVIAGTDEAVKAYLQQLKIPVSSIVVEKPVKQPVKYHYFIGTK